MSFSNGWIASLSSGETVFEEETVPGEKSAWQKLLDRLDNEGLKITQLRLRRGNLVVIGMNHKECDGYCAVYEVSKMIYRDTVSLKQGIGSIVNGNVYLTWIDADGNVRQDVRPLSTMEVHTTMRTHVANYERGSQ